MTASIIHFPLRGRFCRRDALCIEVLRDDEAWLVRVGEHGWLHGSFADAIADAAWLANNLVATITILTNLQPQEIPA